MNVLLLAVRTQITDQRINLQCKCNVCGSLGLSERAWMGKHSKVLRQTCLPIKGTSTLTKNF